MKLIFNVNYRTNWGENVYILGSLPQLGGDDPQKAVPLTLNGQQAWSLTLEVPALKAPVDYHYIVRHENGGVKHEWGPAHRIVPAPGTRTYVLNDRWQDTPWDKPYYSQAFTSCICARPGGRDEALKPAPGHLLISVQAPMIKGSWQVALCGSTPETGAWNPKKAIRLNDHDYPIWRAMIPLAAVEGPCQYKFVIMARGTDEVIAWEGGDNRNLDLQYSAKDATVKVSGLRLINPMAPWKGAGTAIPVFSLRSQDDMGVGDFLDLHKMIDWAADTGQSFVQILPINDTTMTGTWTDSYPYNANSCFALHPMYLRPQAMGRLNDPARMQYFADQARELNALEQIDYERVNKVKDEYFREIFAQEGAATLATAEFKAFMEANELWLQPYAAFCIMRDKIGTPDFEMWGEYSHYTPKVLQKILHDHPQEASYIYYLQYHADRQMRQARDYAHSRGVAIKGDIPIGISRTSVDAWVDTRLFNMDCQAGAPPDDFSVLGQNWGFPTYNWEEMGRDGFKWWKDRFRKMSQYFDAYRIDHVLGFFRIWQIPMDALHGLLGVFHPALPFTPDELRQNYDFWLDVDLQTTPYIMEAFLHDFFGDFTPEVINTFLQPVGYGRYKLREAYNTQRKVAAFFANQPPTDKNNRICSALLGLIDDVLFIEDPYEKGKYHPRISAQFTYIYRSLSDYERWCFDRLYNDFYYHRHNDFWYGKAMWKLPPLIDATDMLCCAEDLGMIPDCVPAVMSALQILSLEIQRMPKDPSTPFGNTWSYPYYSVCTTSTHDMDGIRAWWEEDRAKTQQYYNDVLHMSGTAPYYAEPWICDKIIELNLRSPSMLCIIPWQDWLSTSGELRREKPADERINIPANPRHYWRYRMHRTLEDMLGQKAFNTALRDKIRASGR